MKLYITNPSALQEQVSEPGAHVSPMLCRPPKFFSQWRRQLRLRAGEKMFIYIKYNGWRMFAATDGSTVNLFQGRNGNKMTGFKADWVRKALELGLTEQVEYSVDGEMCGFHVPSGELRYTHSVFGPNGFSTAEEDRGQVGICVVLFDCLHAGNVHAIRDGLKLRDRRALLEKTFHPVTTGRYRLIFAERKELTADKQVDDFLFSRVMMQRAEGFVLKADDVYKPGSEGWIKATPAHAGYGGKTPHLDVAVLGCSGPAKQARQFLVGVADDAVPAAFKSVTLVTVPADVAKHVRKGLANSSAPPPAWAVLSNCAAWGSTPTCYVKDPGCILVIQGARFDMRKNGGRFSARDQYGSHIDQFF